MTLPDSKNRQRSRSIARVLNDDASLINIKTFAIAARYMSFKAAARHLGLTSGAVSHRIARLEKELGFPLFNRLTRAVSLTPEGERLRDVYLNAFQKIYEEITQLLQDDFSSLTIYAAPSLALAWLIPQLSDFQQRYPSMQLHVRTGNAPIDFHGDSTVDVALYYAESHVSGLTSRKFMDEATLPVCSPEYAQKHDLIGHPENLPACTLLHDSAAWHYAATTAWVWLWGAAASSLPCWRNKSWSPPSPTCRPPRRSAPTTPPGPVIPILPPSSRASWTGWKKKASRAMRLLPA